MMRLSATLLALGLVAATGAASAQAGYGSGPYYGSNSNTSSSQAVYGQSGYNQSGYNQAYPDRYGNSSGAIYDYARVVRVDPVIDSRYGYGSTSTSAQRCYDSNSASGYGNDPYQRDNAYGNDPYYPQQQSGYGTTTGRTMATVLGGIAGAVLGSKVGGGSGTYAATAIGSMVGGMAGRQVYENTQRNRARTGTVRVCDPEPVRDGYSSYPASDGRVNGYDVTYAYAGRQFTTRTNYHPGDRIRVRVDVRPE